jgi:hypothetical protein
MEPKECLCPARLVTTSCGTTEDSVFAVSNNNVFAGRDFRARTSLAAFRMISMFCGRRARQNNCDGTVTRHIIHSEE